LFVSLSVLLFALITRSLSALLVSPVHQTLARALQRALAPDVSSPAQRLSADAELRLFLRTDANYDTGRALLLLLGLGLRELALLVRY
jgi:hypothetical protein